MSSCKVFALTIVIVATSPLVISASDAVEIARNAAASYAWDEWLYNGKPYMKTLLEEENDVRPGSYKRSAEQIDSIVDAISIDSIYARTFLDKEFATIFRKTRLFFFRSGRDWKGFVAVHGDSTMVTDYWRDTSDTNCGDFCHETALVNRLLEYEGVRKYEQIELFELVDLIVTMRQRRSGAYPINITNSGEIFSEILSSFRLRDILLDDTPGLPPSASTLAKHFEHVNWDNLRRIDSLMQRRSLIGKHWAIKLFYLMRRGYSKSGLDIVYVKMAIVRFVNNQFEFVSEVDLGDIEKLEYDPKMMGKTIKW